VPENKIYHECQPIKWECYQSVHAQPARKFAGATAE